MQILIKQPERKFRNIFFNIKTTLVIKKLTYYSQMVHYGYVLQSSDVFSESSGVEKKSY